MSARRLTAVALGLGLALVAIGCKSKEPPKPRIADDPVIGIANDDQAMNHAIAQARAHLGVFEAELAKAEPGKHFSVKKPFPTATGDEHMWLTRVKVVDGGFEGTLDNEARDAKDAKVGERYTVARADVSDWIVSDDDGRLWGGYTVRVLLPSMDDGDRKAMEAQLQPLPP